ncbi:MAG TPA: class I SAM-dependent methyltransferase [Polyangia bacterium]|nr:class I SAM-dependent methyltransferase [Polyangia bacterium]
MGQESPHAASDRAKFDAYADDYAAVHRQNIAITGEPPEYFAVYKRTCLERLVGEAFDLPVLEFGCGVGMVTEQLAKRFSQVEGYDPSEQSVGSARSRVPGARFHTSLADIPDGKFGLVVLSGVLHHVHPQERDGVLRQAVGKLRPGDGRLVVFEHNPLNPLTRRAVAGCAFDDDAILLWPWEVRRLLKDAGLRAVELRFIVFLPRALARLRFIEPYLGAVPIGAQVMLVGTRA